VNVLLAAVMVLAVSF